MKKCKYCDFAYDDATEDLLVHLNKTHAKCFYCNTVYGMNNFDDDYNICGLCREEDNEEHITRDKNDDDIKRNR
jgi:hypothetical protein